MPPPIWTQHVEVRWRPEIRYFEHRYEVLRRLEESDLLGAFRALPNERLAVRVGDAEHEMIFGVDHVELTILSPAGDRERMFAALQIVEELIAPRRILRPHIDAQFVVPLEVGYDDARRDIVVSALDTAEIGGVELSDYAAMLDGITDAGDTTVLAEYGIVEQEELPARLARTTGRFPGLGREAVSTHQWKVDQDLPESAFFADIVCQRKVRLPEGQLLQGLTEAWQASLDIMGNVVDELVDRTCAAREGDQ
jgi:hypothetical protein